jgi:hypothetical protein
VAHEGFHLIADLPIPEVHAAGRSPPDLLLAVAATVQVEDLWSQIL